MKRGKRAQFYILAAVIIISIIISLTNVTNYIVTKEITKSDSIFENFNNQMLNAINYCLTKNLGISDCAANLTSLFSNYTAQNTRENFELTIYYGNISSDKKNIGSIKTQTKRDGSISPGGQVSYPTSRVEFDSDNSEVSTDASGNNYVNIIINGVVYQTPVLSDNNFIAVMITGSGENNYVITNQKS